MPGKLECKVLILRGQNLFLAKKQFAHEEVVHFLGLLQDKVLAELDSIFEGDKERPITTMDLSKMKYLEYCVKESLRLFPSVPFMSRELQNDLKLGAS